jgi:hypothetical protein
MSIDSNNGGKSAFDEKGVLDGLIWGFEDLPNIQRHTLKMRLQQCEICVGKCSEERIWTEIWSGGHGSYLVGARARIFSPSRLRPWLIAGDGWSLCL